MRLEVLGEFVSNLIPEEYFKTGDSEVTSMKKKEKCILFREDTHKKKCFF